MGAPQPGLTHPEHISGCASPRVQILNAYPAQEPDWWCQQPLPLCTPFAAAAAKRDPEPSGSF